ncbi:hypothetical protein H6G76_29195 [Nostoc sp. FACHB-152]|uniref:hypothetical protein n=1 Tax=unclassified Nostoc TaxID=2593658 RepID=UPI0016835C3B|nr:MULTISPECIES: hypothetical protein [unclassified Nostoc]MBD2451135.1 hypothetical protein [Nostoc sp. FACHB-152]MBD2473145.1 hypothetical protein [Nostoc sp. FACHB-145]
MKYLTPKDTNSRSNQEPSPQSQYRKNGSGILELLAKWIVTFISFPFIFISHIIAQFVTPGTSGYKLVGAIGFWIGTLLSTDSIWQVLFQGKPIFPWFETEWIGWIGWLQLPFNVLFWISFGISALVQVMEAKTLRGKDPQQAKNEFEDSRQYALGSKPSGNIDLTVALWGDYKRAGMRERYAGGLIALFFWLIDIITTFVGRWPFQYTNPLSIIACFGYNIVAMMAGEIGYSIWKLTK